MGQSYQKTVPKAIKGHQGRLRQRHAEPLKATSSFNFKHPGKQGRSEAYSPEKGTVGAETLLV